MPIIFQITNKLHCFEISSFNSFIIRWYQTACIWKIFVLVKLNRLCSVVRAYILLIYVICEYLKRIYFRKWCHGLYSGPLGIPDSLDGLREDAMFMGVPVTVCVHVYAWVICVCVCMSGWPSLCVCLFDEVSDTSSREGSRVLGFFLWFNENMATVSLFQLLDLYVAAKVIKCLKTFKKAPRTFFGICFLISFIDIMLCKCTFASLAFIHWPTQWHQFTKR